MVELVTSAVELSLYVAVTVPPKLNVSPTLNVVVCPERAMLESVGVDAWLAFLYNSMLVWLEVYVVNLGEPALY